MRSRSRRSASPNRACAMRKSRSPIAKVSSLRERAPQAARRSAGSRSGGICDREDRARECRGATREAARRGHGTRCRCLGDPEADARRSDRLGREGEIDASAHRRCARARRVSPAARCRPRDRPRVDQGARADGGESSARHGRDDGSRRYQDRRPATVSSSIGSSRRCHSVSSIDGVFDSSDVVRNAMSGRLGATTGNGNGANTLALVLGNLMVKADDSTKTKLKALLETGQAAWSSRRQGELIDGSGCEGGGGSRACRRGRRCRADRR